MTQPATLPSGPSPVLRRLWYAGLLLAALLRVALIDRHGLWNNEMITYRVLERGYGEIITERLSVNHMPLYFLMEKAWTDVFGTSEASMRVIAAVFGWLGVWAAGRFARRLGGLRLAVPVVFAAALHQWWLENSLEARMYSILAWAAVESTDAWFAWARRGGRGEGAGRRADLIRWTLVTVFGLYIHMLFGVILALHLVDALVRWRRQNLPLHRFVPALVATAVLCIPISIAWALNQNKFTTSTSEIEFRTPGVLLRKTLHVLWGDYKVMDDPLTRIASYLLFLAAFVGMIAALRGRPVGPSGPLLPDPEARRDLRALGVAYLLFLGGIFLAQGFSSSSMISEARYYAAVAPAVLVLGIAGLLNGVLTGRRWGYLPLAAALLLQATFTGAYYLGVGEGFREGVHTIAGNRSGDHGLVCVTSGGGSIGVKRYYAKHLPDDVLFIDRSEKSTGVVSRELEAYARQYPEFWVLSYHEKRETLWKVLDRADKGYVPLNGEQAFGKTKVQLFRWEGDAAAAEPEPATSLGEAASSRPG